MALSVHPPLFLRYRCTPSAPSFLTNTFSSLLTLTISKRQRFEPKRTRSATPIFFLQSTHKTTSCNTSNYMRQDSCLIFPPLPPTKPLAIIQFFGGAFIGAIPEVTYSYLIELLAKQGFLIVSVPYDVTFDHSLAASEVHRRFNSCLDNLMSFGLPYAGLKASDLEGLPLYSIGHSNGALLQVLVGSYFSHRLPKANAIISFNNRPASEAVPYFEQFGPLVHQATPIIDESPIYTLAASATGDALNVILDVAGALTVGSDPNAIVSLNKFVDQLPAVLNQVSQGISEFRPTPSENREFIKQSYNVPHTLLVKFSDDGIDESDLLESILRPRVDAICGKLENVILSGNHITPCTQDIKWQVGESYTPVDAFAQGLKSWSLNDVRTLAKSIGDWLKCIS
ncbi:hypothetical protein ZOSMA_7G01100 [Zostera marina]|uniref:Alpha/beta-Hydrolases superfamily protein n=1 Tax=Zostera marina TaxID=29655 RepID=A0A0K9NMS5_ZOSMR|nr:hypothetical protein ZOSMA_7G01100 [Zostera marina]